MAIVEIVGGRLTAPPPKGYVPVYEILIPGGLDASQILKLQRAQLSRGRVDPSSDIYEGSDSCYFHLDVILFADCFRVDGDPVASLDGKFASLICEGEWNKFQSAFIATIVG